MSMFGGDAPQGVAGNTDEPLAGDLLRRLRAHIASTGGSYSVG